MEHLHLLVAKGFEVGEGLTILYNVLYLRHSAQYGQNIGVCGAELQRPRCGGHRGVVLAQHCRHALRQVYERAATNRLHNDYG